jgi:DNA-binding CsgD family transcriptional regulator
MAELCAGNPVAVDAALGPLGDTVRNSGAGDPVLGVFVPDEIEALVEMGQVERAEALLHWFEERATVLDRAWARAMTGRCKGLLEAARDRYERAVEALEEALVQHDRAGIPLDRARTLLVLGRILRRAGRRARAKAALEEAQKLFETVGAQGWERRARDELRRLGQRTSAPDALTATERQVAELAASGLSNKEVAERAFVSVKGVEANLTRVYRKLGIHSRSGLARALTGNAHDPEK